MKVHAGYLRKKEAAQYLSISLRTLSEWQRRKILSHYKPARKVCLFSIQDLERCLERFKVREIGGAE